MKSSKRLPLVQVQGILKRFTAILYFALTFQLSLAQYKFREQNLTTRLFLA